jgi:hypothetical protein
MNTCLIGGRLLDDEEPPPPPLDPEDEPETAALDAGWDDVDPPDELGDELGDELELPPDEFTAAGWLT